MLVATDESADTDAVSDELCAATFIPDVDPDPVFPPWDSEVALRVRSLPVDVGLIMHVDVPLDPPLSVLMLVQSVTTENHDVPLDSVVTTLLSWLDPAVLDTVMVAVTCSFSVRDLEGRETETVSAACAELTATRKNIIAVVSKIVFLIFILFPPFLILPYSFSMLVC